MIPITVRIGNYVYRFVRKIWTNKQLNNWILANKDKNYVKSQKGWIYILRIFDLRFLTLVRVKDSLCPKELTCSCQTCNRLHLTVCSSLELGQNHLIWKSFDVHQKCKARLMAWQMHGLFRFILFSRNIQSYAWTRWSRLYGLFVNSAWFGIVLVVAGERERESLFSSCP